MAVRARADPDVRLGGRDGERADAVQRRRIVEPGAAAGQVGEALAGLLAADAGLLVARRRSRPAVSAASRGSTTFSEHRSGSRSMRGPSAAAHGQPEPAQPGSVRLSPISRLPAPDAITCRSGCTRAAFGPSVVEGRAARRESAGETSSTVPVEEPRVSESPRCPPTPIPAGRKLVFVITEDWFFASHFLPMARAARELGLDVAVVTRVREHRAAIEATGARVIPLEAERSSLNPMAAGYAAGQLAAILKAREARHRPLHRAARHPRRRRGGRDGGHPAPDLRADRARLSRRPAETRRGASRDERSAVAGARPRDQARRAICSRIRTIPALLGLDPADARA